MQLNDELNVHEKINAEKVQGFKYFLRMDIKPLPFHPIWRPNDNDVVTAEARIKIPNSVDLSMCKIRFCDENNKDLELKEWSLTIKLEKVYEVLNTTDINTLPLVNKRPRRNFF